MTSELAKRRLMFSLAVKVVRWDNVSVNTTLKVYINILLSYFYCYLHGLGKITIFPAPGRFFFHSSPFKLFLTACSNIYEYPDHVQDVNE